MERSKDKIILFDVDGTLTKPRNVKYLNIAFFRPQLISYKIMNSIVIEQDMVDTLLELKKKYYVAVVGGSDLAKITEQLTKPILESLDYCFSENGLYAYKGGKFFEKKSFNEYLGEERLQKFLNTTLRLLSEIDIPIKRGTFIEYRTGMLNISPIGRNCSQQERDDFEKYDLVKRYLYINYNQTKLYNFFQ